MPEEKPTIAKISAEVNGGDYSAVGLRMDLRINSFPTVTAMVAGPTEGDDSIAEPVSAQVLENIAALQAARLEGRSEPDLEVEAQDGQGGSVSYAGFISSPVLEITKHSTGNKIASVGQAAALDALDLSIYKADYHVAREEAGSDLGAIPAAEDGDVPGLLSKITDVLVSNYEASLAKEYRPVAKEMLRLQHEINTDTDGPLDLWKSILSGSDVVYEKWFEAFDTSGQIAVTLSERVKDMLKASTPGFWNKVKSLLSSFQMFYVPAFDGPGYFLRADKKVEDEGAIEIEASVSGLTVTDGSPKILQPGGVVMQTSSTITTARPEAQADPDTPRLIAYAPDPLRKGFIQRENPPLWLPRPKGVTIFGSEVESSVATDGDGEVDLSLKERKERKQKGTEYKKKVDLVSEGMLTELCEVMFKEIQLAHSTAGLTLPLDFSMNDKVGKRATIKIAGEDGGEFTAFISGVSHSVDLRQGREMNSYTKLNLTHAKY